MVSAVKPQELWSFHVKDQELLQWWFLERPQAQITEALSGFSSREAWFHVREVACCPTKSVSVPCRLNSLDSTRRPSNSKLAPNMSLRIRLFSFAMQKLRSPAHSKRCCRSSRPNGSWLLNHSEVRDWVGKEGPCNHSQLWEIRSLGSLSLPSSEVSPNRKSQAC